MSFGFTARGRFPLSEFDDDTANTGITVSTHETLDTLVHKLSENSFKEFIYSGNQLTSSIAWTDNGKTLKIREASFTYSGGKVATSVKRQYNGAGAVVQTLSSTFTYSSGKLASIDVVRT